MNGYLRYASLCMVCLLQVNKETAIKNTVRLKYCEFNTLPAMVGQFTQMPAIGFQGRKMLQALPMHNGETSDPYAVPGLTRPRVTLPESVAASFLKVSYAFGTLYETMSRRCF